MATTLAAVWDATSIENICKQQYASGNNATDCKWFVRAVAEHLLDPDTFPDRSSGLDADAVIGQYLSDSANGWTNLGKNQAAAISEVTAGKFVVGAMTSSELGDTNGHLAVIIGGTEYSGGAGKDVPRCYSGSISASGRVPRTGSGFGVTWSFGKTNADNISYFSITPTKTMAETLYDLSAPLADFTAANVVREMMKELKSLGSTAVDSEGERILFPKGVNKIDIVVVVGTVRIELHASGS